MPDLFPGPVLASLRADPDRPAFEIGPRTVSRVVVAPAVGRFYPDRTRRSGSRLRDKDPVWAGIGQVDSQRVSTPVCSPFERRLMGMLAEAGGTSSQANWSLGCGSAAARPALDDHWKGVIAMPEPAPPPLQVPTTYDIE